MAALAEIWRYPVKSMRGERLRRSALEGAGLEGDRRWALRDRSTGRLVSAKQDGLLLSASARLVGGQPVIHLPDGRELAAADPDLDAVLSEWLGRPVAFEEAVPGDSSVYGMHADPEDETSPLLDVPTPAGTFLDAGPVHVLTTATLRAMAARAPDSSWRAERFRPTLLVEAGGAEFVEDGWVGKTAAVGTARLTVVMPTLRCGIPAREQPGLPADSEIVRVLKSERALLLGVYATVDVPGQVAEGDEVEIL